MRTKPNEGKHPRWFPGGYSGRPLPGYGQPVATHVLALYLCAKVARSPGTTLQQLPGRAGSRAYDRGSQQNGQEQSRQQNGEERTNQGHERRQ
ncbi:hypothetical protein [Hymenobacter swuensis]|uniref:hypothetical protein n=1 Tax=Hymenobacter swuensis TaxID=1446467 RepID=UPI0018CC6898|nr:hypothetical protein [Hymenobacter swuensis]